MRRFLSYGFTFRDGRKIMYIRKGVSIWKFNLLVSEVRLSEEDAVKVFEFATIEKLKEATSA